MKTLTALFALASLTTLSGLAFSGDQYDVNVRASPATVNARTTVKVGVAPKGPYHMNMEYPVKLALTAPDGVKLEKEKLAKDDAKRFEKAGLDFEVAFVPSSAGKKSFTGTLRFAVCTDTDCKPMTESVAFDVDVH